MDLHIELDTRETNWALLHDSTFSRLFDSKVSPVAKIEFESKTFFVSVKSDKSVTDPNGIRLSRDLANCWSLSHNDSVFVTAYCGILRKSTKPIVVCPASVDDWEVVESSAQFLQDNMLSQLSIVVPGQKFPVWTTRGQKAIILQVDQHTIDGFDEMSREPILLSHDSEIAVQVLARRDVSRTTRRGCLHARVVDEGFPSDLPNIGIVCNQSDFCRFFSPDSGCLVTVRDRPEILTLIACDSNLVDPGVVLVSPTMRDKYSLVSGERVVIEEQTAEIGNSIVIPKTVYLYVATKWENKKSWKNKLEKNIAKSICVIVPQGGWIDLGNDQQHEYCLIRFGLMTDTKIGALLTSENFDSIEIIVDQLSTDQQAVIKAPQPFTKYIPEKVKEYQVVKSRREVNNLDPLSLQILPSYEPMVRDMHSYLESSIMHANINLPFAGSGVMIGHSAGSGKSTALRQALARFSPPIDYAIINCSVLSNPSLFRLEEVKLTLAGLVKYGFETPPYGIVFDNVDDLIPPEVDEPIDSVSGQPGSEGLMRKIKRGKILCAFLEDLLYKLKPNRSIFLAATAVRDSKSLARLFVHCEKLPRTLTRDDRNILLMKSENIPNIDLSKYSFMELVEIRKTGKDNREIRRQLLAGQSGQRRVLASKRVTELGGMDEQIETLVDAIMLPLEFPYLFPPAITPPTGAFVIGPSGCGKSALIDKIIAETKLPVEIIRGPDLLDKYIGASEQGVRNVFEKAVAIAPCIVVFDAIEALCPRRGSEGTGVTDRVVNQMLCYLDGVERMEQVFVIAISSRPDLVDPALIRSGRLDITVICDVPDYKGREEIAKIFWDEFVTNSHLTPSILNQLVTSIADGCTGADIRAGFVNAKIEHSRDEEGTNLVELVMKNVRAIKPSLSSKERDMYKQILSRYRGGGCPPPTVGTQTMLR
jgi:SpoVK/Ycf46/Vps4 family AAA+-type ATPase